MTLQSGRLGWGWVVGVQGREGPLEQPVTVDCSRVRLFHEATIFGRERMIYLEASNGVKERLKPIVQRRVLLVHQSLITHSKGGDTHLHLGGTLTSYVFTTTLLRYLMSPLLHLWFWMDSILFGMIIINVRGCFIYSDWPLAFLGVY